MRRYFGFLKLKVALSSQRCWARSELNLCEEVSWLSIARELIIRSVHFKLFLCLKLCTTPGLTAMK